MKTFKIIILGSALIISNAQNLLSQTLDGKESRKIQVTFAYPIGSAGTASRNYSNNLSLNVLYGLNGGVNGFEFGSLWNHNDGEVKWMQVAGLANTTNGNSQGLIISGIANINSGSIVGADISGVLNYSHKYLSGVHIAGVANIGLDSSKGALVSGVLNFTKGSSKGFQVSTVNVANDLEGFQVGVLNFSKRLKGFQLGVINIIKEDSEKALPLGLISIVKDGFYEFDLTAGEAIYSNLNYKMGVERFYTIFKVGYSRYQEKPVYNYGWGIGTGIFLSDRQRLNIEVSASQICYNYNWNPKHNGLNKLDLNYRFYILDNLSFLIGPSFNVYITGESVNGKYGTINIPYTFYEHEYADKKLFSWIGFNAGISIKL
ncbi:MAG: hypothetical protein IQL11_15630 [Bacteroidales bacterium]|nr:hypothetical protein [Bacteroidales bacterium]